MSKFTDRNKCLWVKPRVVKPRPWYNLQNTTKQSKLYGLSIASIVGMPTDREKKVKVTHSRVANGGFVCTFMSRPKLFKNYLIEGH